MYPNTKHLDRPKITPFRSKMQRLSIRRLATVTANLNEKYKVVFVGAGSGGLSAASQLARLPEFSGKKDILIVDPAKIHYYQPLWTFVGAGLKTLKESCRPMKDLIPTSSNFLNKAVKSVTPETNSILIDDGSTIQYDYLVMAPGIQINYDKVKGLTEALEDPNSPVSTNYSDKYVEKTNRLIREFPIEKGKFGIDGGRAVFTQPSTPVKCAGKLKSIIC